MNRDDSLSVGDLAQRAGCNVETVRYYEKAGLMPKPPRTEGGHRVYSKPHLKRLYFIRRSRELGFSLEQVRELLRLVDEPDHTCGEVKAIALVQARDIAEKIKDLERLQKVLNDLSVKCVGDRYTVDQCPIIEALFEA